MSAQYDSRFSDKYSEYNKVLRTWFVAFGVGVPGTLLLNTDTRILVTESGSAEFLLLCLLGGTALQIFVTFLNKYVAWSNDLILDRKAGRNPSDPPAGPITKAIASLAEKIWIDFAIDVITGVLFMLALARLYAILI